MLCVNYYFHGVLKSRRFDFSTIGEAQREAELYTQSFMNLGHIAIVSHYDE